MAVRMDNCFQLNRDHLLAELKRIELLIQIRLWRLRESDNHPENRELAGLFFSEEKANEVFAHPNFAKLDEPQHVNMATDKLKEALRQTEGEIAVSKTENACRGISTRLDELAELFGLSTFEIDILLICLLAELKPEFHSIFAYLQNDATRKSPDVNLVFQLLCNSFEDTLRAREVFSAEAPLVKHHLLRLYDDQASQPVPLLSQFLKIDERISSYLLGSDGLDVNLLHLTDLIHPSTKFTDIILPGDMKDRLTSLIAQFKNRPVIFYLKGTRGVGRHATSEAVCVELGIPLLSIDVGRVLAGNSCEPLIPLIFREGLLQGAALYFNEFELWLNDERTARLSYEILVTGLNHYPNWVFLAGERDFQPGGKFVGRPFISIDFPMPAYDARKRLWQIEWERDPSLPIGIDLGELADKFRLNGGQIHDVVAMARNLALWRDPKKGAVTPEDVYIACRQQFRETLNTLSHRIIPKYSWEDIVLPKDQMEQLREIYNYMKYYNTVYGDWGFGRRISLGKGLNVLFAGPSGTGKTMAAEILAGELKLDLYKIDLSAIVSKYIGETEKNLDRIFREGQTSNAILFFDEADALFGKRSEVRDSHDRYANVEVAYLLQRMEEYDGVVIMATNMRKNMDEAFARRLHFALEFPIPEEPDRYRIWKGVFPAEAPFGADVDLAFMARQFKISGGNIKNIALSAAFLAAENGGHITMNNLIKATRREYQKAGKLCTEGDFGEYFELLKG
jgi:SpoVK/Ycf46/Vps4 family AAA+-type ATPase